MNDWSKNFISKVEQMRDAQKMYFKTRDKEWLIKSKSLESEVDNLIAISYQRGNNIPSDN